MNTLNKLLDNKTSFKNHLITAAGVLALAIAGISHARASQTLHKTIEVAGQQIFYREAGDNNAPTIVLLHGFPTSSHMYRNLIPELAQDYHVIAPDYPGFGNSSMPAVDEFEYSFDNLAKITDAFLTKVGAEEYSLYVMDYGAPVGFRIAAAHPERVQGLIVQNGNAYDEGLRDFWKPIKAYWQDKSPANAKVLKDSLLTIEATQWQYTNGARNKETISPDNWIVDQAKLDRPGNKAIQLELFYSYGTNPALYPQWQAYFRKHQPPTLLVWGKGDYIFPEEGAHPYKRDLKKLDFHILDTGHFALEEDGDVIAGLIQSFMKNKVLAK
ncbi:alpha/beta fold hydrolase [Thalassomonas actiniarum]|uniref:Alpha/beta hydrolase n=1 Tax=Thalassomonas actiniarum TaxID=485447 RepID=A0AAE9YWD3_9GAMM|nr:alpha/beta hydrolase [Thalassomonas actiniarum]WDE00782.1 alpha/beta hydrolase [Thalassomonas actiniarum]